MHARFSSAGVPPLSLLFACLLSVSSPGSAGAESPIPMQTEPALTSEVPAVPLPDSLQPPAQEPDYLLEEEDRTAAAESEAAEDPAAVASEPSTEIPPAEALLQLKPLSGTTARFADLLTPPAEVIQEAAVEQGSESDNVSEYNVPIVLDPSVQGHIRFFNVAIRNRFEQWLTKIYSNPTLP